MQIEKTQSEKFKQAARELGCDEDEVRWDDSLKRVVKQKDTPNRERNNA